MGVTTPMPAKRPRPLPFVTFEGTEGAGKSTLLSLLRSELLRRGVPNEQMLFSREPGGSELAEGIRHLLLNRSMDATTELLLYEAARAEHLHSVIRPALEAGRWVFCDRYSDSSLAYQGSARGIAWKQVRELNRVATQGLAPTLTFWIDVDPAVGLARATDPNRFEKEGLAFQKKVRAGYLKIKREEPRRFCAIRVTGQTPLQLATVVLKELERRFPQLPRSKEDAIASLTRKRV